MALLLNYIEPEIEKILGKNQYGFQRNRSISSQILTTRRILLGVWAKNLEVTLSFIDFPKTFDFIDRGKMEQILLAHGLPKETVTDFFDIFAGIFQWDTLAPYLFIIWLDYVHWKSIDLMRENSFTVKKKKKSKKLTIPRRNYYGPRLCRFHSSSSKYPFLKPNPCCIVYSRQ